MWNVYHTTDKREDFHKETCGFFSQAQQASMITLVTYHVLVKARWCNNIGDGTLLFDASETANLSPSFCLENSLFSRKSWRYFGSQSLGSVMLDGGASQMSTSSLNQIAARSFFCLRTLSMLMMMINSTLNRLVILL